MEQRTFRAAIIGCGGISRVHIAALQEMKNVEIAAVCDIREDRLKAAVEKTGAKGYADWHEVVALKDIDVVHICLPHYLHAPVAIEALNQGRNVITEKPMASTIEDARAMIAAAEREGAPMLGVIFQNRYNSSVQHAKRIIDSGEMGAFLGAAASVCWRREGSYYSESGWRGVKATEGAGSLINQSIHTLDLLSFLGGPIEKVRGSVFTGLNEGQIEVEDNAMAVALYAGGQRALIHTSNNNVADDAIEVNIHLEKGLFKMFGPKLYLVENGEFKLIDSGDDKAIVGKTVWGNGHSSQLEDYYSCLAEGRHFWIDGRSAFPALSLVLSIVRSSEEGKWVELYKA